MRYSSTLCMCCVYITELQCNVTLCVVYQKVPKLVSNAASGCDVLSDCFVVLVCPSCQCICNLQRESNMGPIYYISK